MLDQRAAQAAQRKGMMLTARNCGGATHVSHTYGAAGAMQTAHRQEVWAKAPRSEFGDLCDHDDAHESTDGIQEEVAEGGHGICDMVVLLQQAGDNCLRPGGRQLDHLCWALHQLLKRPRRQLQTEQWLSYSTRESAYGTVPCSAILSKGAMCNRRDPLHQDRPAERVPVQMHVTLKQQIQHRCLPIFLHT